MKITIDCRMISMSGIGRYINDIVPKVCATFSEVILLGKFEELEALKCSYPSVRIIEMTAPIYSVKEQIQLRKLVPQCDLFWSPHYNVPIFNIKAKKRVVTIHDVFHMAFFKQLSFPQKVYAKVVLRAALKKSSTVITISNFSKSEILKYSSPKYAGKIQVIYRCVSDAVQKNNEKSQQISSIQKDKYFLFVGNVKPHKNLKRTIEAFKKLLIENQGQCKDLFFKIVGKKDGFLTGDNDIQKLVENDELLKDRVNFTGHLSDAELESLYKQAICLVFPSYYEGFGLPPLEAMALGCPTITSNAASLPEICGDASLYFDPFSVDDIAGRMLEILSGENIRSALSTKGHIQVRKFNWEVAIEKHLTLFQSLK